MTGKLISRQQLFDWKSLSFSQVVMHWIQSWRNNEPARNQLLPSRKSTAAFLENDIRKKQGVGASLQMISRRMRPHHSG
jgi:hypothetical protein